MAFRLPRFNAKVPIVDKEGRPTAALLQQLNVQWAGGIERQEGAQTEVLDRLDQQQATIIRSLRALSHTDGAFITAEPDGATAKAVITAHTRNYLDSVVPVNAGMVLGLAYATTYSIFYDDPERDGGAVVYQATVTPSEAVTSAAHPDRDLVGAVTTPATSGSPPTDGGSGTPPGYPSDYPYEVIP